MAKKNKRSARRTTAHPPAQASAAPAGPQTSSAQPAKPAYVKAQARPRPEPKPKRTAIFTIAVAYVVLHGLVWSAAIFATNRAAVDSKPILYALLLGASLADVAAGVGLWLWKQWGAYVFLASGLLTAALATAVSGSLWVGLGTLMPAVIVAYITLPKVEQATKAAAA